ncbi:MAG: hypothetical protein N2Z76_09510 [Treponemataceae bacterium]|nr:hypothetical protein [Treponemataceae bacterium]
MMEAYFIVGGLVLWGLSLWYLRWYVQKRTEPGRILEKLEAEVAQLVREIDATTDRDITLIEERVKQLKALLEETDRRIISYKRELDRRVQEERAYQELGRRAKSVGSVPHPSFQSKGTGVLFPELEAPYLSPRKGEENTLPLQEESLGKEPPVRMRNKAVPASFQSSSFEKGVVPETGETVFPFPRENLPSRGGTAFGGEGADEKTTPPYEKTKKESPLVPQEKETSNSQTFPSFVRSSVPIQPKPPPLGEQVLNLYRSGISTEVIAKKLGITVAEVELALTVESRRQQERPFL